MKPETTRKAPSGRICQNEGCSRPAGDRYCDTCQLEFSLFHRETRQGRPGPAPRPAR